MFASLNYIEEALDFFTKAEHIATQLKNQALLATISNRTGDLYKFNAYLASEQARKDSLNRLALSYYQKELAIRKAIKQKTRIGSLQSIAFTYEQLNQDSLALRYFNEAMSLVTEKNSLNRFFGVLKFIKARLLFKKGQTQEAEALAFEGIEIEKKLFGKPTVIDHYELLSDLYFQKKDYAKAYQYHLIYQELRDKQLYNPEAIKAAQQLRKDSEAEKEAIKRQEAEKERQIQQLYLVLAGSFVLVVLFILGLVYRNNLRQKKTNRLLHDKNEEITQQSEELNSTLELVEREGKKSDNLLLNILPEETAQELKEKGSATPQHYDLVTVLFTDFKSFSQIAEKLSPQEVIENLNTCFLALDEICERHNLEKIKTIGDSYMCAGGIPLTNTSNPIDCVQAGLEMQAWLANWKKEKEAKDEQTWELRLGIHSGPVVAGVIGKNKFAYDIWGDTVNLASRMESSGEVGKVNISGITYQLVKDQFQCEYRGKIEAKNKGEVEMYFVAPSPPTGGGVNPKDFVNLRKQFKLK